MYKKYCISVFAALGFALLASTACDSEFVKQEDCRLFCEKSAECSESFTESMFDTCWSYCEELDKKWDGLANVSFNQADFACVEHESCDEFNACVKSNVGYDGSDGDIETDVQSEAEASE